ncbi:MAG: DVU_1557 family redox protein [Lentihominibacter sp.]|jgi:hypothetical protein
MAKKLIKTGGASAGTSAVGGDDKPPEILICEKCRVELEMIEVAFDYLSRSFRHKVPRCPECGQVSLPEDLVTGKIADVESMIEEK